jgi:uncharacterized protein (TIGR04255 family)
MTRVRYPKPPIIETLIDLQVDFAEGAPTLDSLARLGQQIEANYPAREELYSFGIEVNVQTGTEVKTNRELVGYRFWNKSRDRVVQFRTNGLLFSRLPTAENPYDEWEVSSAEINRLWPLYRDALRPTNVRRLGVRYINRVRLPPGKTTLDEFFTARPELPRAIPLAIRSFIMRLAVPLPDLPDGLLIVGQGTANDETTPDGQTDVLLDLDLVRTVHLSTFDDDSEVWTTLNDLHSRENALFETFITPATRELFN